MTRAGSLRFGAATPVGTARSYTTRDGQEGKTGGAHGARRRDAISGHGRVGQADLSASRLALATIAARLLRLSVRLAAQDARLDVEVAGTSAGIDGLQTDARAEDAGDRSEERDPCP